MLLDLFTSFRQFGNMDFNFSKYSGYLSVLNTNFIAGVNPLDLVIYHKLCV